MICQFQIDTLVLALDAAEEKYNELTMAAGKAAAAWARAASTPAPPPQENLDRWRRALKERGDLHHKMELAAVAASVAEIEVRRLRIRLNDARGVRS